MSSSLKKVQSVVLCAFLILFLSGSPVLAQTNFNWTSIPGTTNLTWVACYSAPIQCTRLNVPLNYSDPSAGEATLAVIRIPSPLNETANYRGPVLFNPGGPGQSGVDTVVQMGAQIATVIGPEFDLVSFDPRGIANTVPLISFFENDAERAAFDLGPEVTDATATSGILPTQWAHFQVFGHLAQDRDNGFLAHVTTDNVARDMLTIVEAHGQTKLRYWGISYGSVLGATFASMFPDKVERLIIDGVLDMEGYYNTISKNIDALYQQVLAQPAVAYAPSLPEYGIVDHATVKNTFLSAFYTPYSSFVPLAQGLADLRKENGSNIFQISSPHFSEVVAAVACGDGQPVTDDAAALEKYAHITSNKSSFSSEVVGIRTMCSGWRIHPNNFKGPIGGNTSFPLMLIGNTADPVTPLETARKTSSSFPGSVVLIQDSPGHTSFTSPSECTLGYVQRYFQNGTLPAVGTVCPVTADLFPVSSNATSTSTRRQVSSKTPLGDVVEALRGSYGKVIRHHLI